MRVTQKILTDRAMWNLNHILSRVIRTQDELSSGKQVLAPSDSPVKINHILSLRTSINRLDQYRDNIQDAINWLNLVDQSIDSSVAVNQVVQTIALQAANGTLTESERKILADQVESYLEEMVGNGNISFGDKYLFAGTETLTRPFSVTSGTPEDRRIKTGNALDIAIQGEGYFQLVKFDDNDEYKEIYYTRAGSFDIQWTLEGSSQVGRLVNRENIPLLVTVDGTIDSDPLIIPRDHKSIEIGQDGTVTVTLADGSEETYQIHLARFPDEDGLTEAGSGLYRKADNYDGSPVTGVPGGSGLGVLHSGYLETSAKLAYHGNSGIIVHEVESDTTMNIGFPGDEVLFRGFQVVGSELSTNDIGQGPFVFTINGREITLDNTAGSIKTPRELANQLNLAFNRDTQLRHEVYATVDGSRLLLRSRTEDILEFTEIDGTPLQDWGIIGYTRVGSGEIDVTVSATGTFQINDVDITINLPSSDVSDLADEINFLLQSTSLQNVVFVSANTANNTLEFYTNDGTVLELTDVAGGLLLDWGILDNNGRVNPDNATSTILRPEAAEGALKVVRDMQYYLRTNDFQKISSVGLQGLKDNLDTLVRVRSQAGARTLRMETHLTRYDDFSVNFKRLLSQKEDIDVAAVVMRLQEHENVYQMALAATARAIQPTLLNFLR